MRERFELHCKTIGLILFCIGAFYTVNSALLFFQKPPDVTRMVPQSALRLLSPSDIAGLQASTSYTRKHAFKPLLLLGIAPLGMGIYLMRSNNLFVRLCYPKTGKPVSAVGDSPAKPAQPDMSTKIAGTIGDKKPDSQYAPPGYFQ